MKSIQAALGWESRTKLTELDNSGFDPSRCEVHQLPNEFCYQQEPDRRQFAIVIDNVLTPEECNQWIADTEAMKYEQALVNVGGGRNILITDYRNSLRCIVDDEERAAELWDRIRHFIPSDLQFRQFVPCELNERLRFLRYDPGDYFLPHGDGCYEHPPGRAKGGDRSFVTFQLYLNEGFQGGSTRVFAERGSNSAYYDVVPKTGSVFLFEHQMHHSGELLEEGRKYAIRTDVMFTRRTVVNHNALGSASITTNH